jgi:hypothetical protein
VIYGCERIAEMIEKDAEMRHEVADLRQRLYRAMGKAAAALQPCHNTWK